MVDNKHVFRGQFNGHKNAEPSEHRVGCGERRDHIHGLCGTHLKGTVLKVRGCKCVVRGLDQIKTAYKYTA